MRDLIYSSEEIGPNIKGLINSDCRQAVIAQKPGCGKLDNQNKYASLTLALHPAHPALFHHRTCFSDALWVKPNHRDLPALPQLN